MLQNLMLRGCIAGLLLVAGSAIAAPTEIIRGGATKVRLAPAFLQALTSLKVTPSAIAPGRLNAGRKGVSASFNITTGAVDSGTVRAEVDHAGGLALTAGATRVELSSFIIELGGDRTPVLTGLVAANGNLVGRLPLFDLKVAGRGVAITEERLTVSDVDVTLNQGAADALNGIFGVRAFTSQIQIGTAQVRAQLDGDDRDEH